VMYSVWIWTERIPLLWSERHTKTLSAPGVNSFDAEVVGNAKTNLLDPIKRGEAVGVGDHRGIDAD
jgi:hypothetical protein